MWKTPVHRLWASNFIQKTTFIKGVLNIFLFTDAFNWESFLYFFKLDTKKNFSNKNIIRSKSVRLCLHSEIMKHSHVINYLPANVSVPAIFAVFSVISTSMVPSLCMPGGNPKAAMASVTRTRPESYKELRLKRRKKELNFINHVVPDKH